MTKRPNRLSPIEHERRQIENLKTLEPNTTPKKYQTLSNGLADVAMSALNLMAALECGNHPDFERFYDLVDGLADLVDGEAEPVERQVPSAEQFAKQEPVPLAQPVKLSAPAGKGITTMKTTIVGRPDSIKVEGDTVTLQMNYMPKPGANGQYSLPKGVPAPMATTTPVMAYVGKKQFDKVKAQLDDPDDSLIIEGAVSQIVNGVLCVYASNITSKLLQSQKALAQKVAAQDGS